MRIISSGLERHDAICKCGCIFEFEAEDIIITLAKPRYVICPECGRGIRLDAKRRDNHE